MRLLLDTHVLLWALIAPKRLGKVVQTAIESPDNEVMFSAASIWEIAIKSALRKTGFPVTPDEIAAAAVASGFVELPVRSAAAAHAAKLPAHHRDPFDRLLIAQAIMEPATFYTADSQLKVYSELVRCISRFQHLILHAINPIPALGQQISRACLIILLNTLTE